MSAPSGVAMASRDLAPSGAAPIAFAVLVCILLSPLAHDIGEAPSGQAAFGAQILAISVGFVAYIAWRFVADLRGEEDA